jgi:radical SAM protein with 4Fe4S-binding SPASM domain
MMREFLPDHTPVISYLELTLRCNHRCVQCYVEENIPAERDELTRHEIQTVLSDLADLGSLIAVVTGGEALLRPDALDIMRDLRKLGYAVVLFSNGSLITEAMARQLYDIALLAVEISLHGPTAEIHDAVTGVPGSYHRAVNAMRMLGRNNVRTKLKCNLLKANDGEINTVIALAKELGVEYTFDPFIYPQRDGNPAPVSQRLCVEDIRHLLGDPRLDGEPVRPDERSYLANGNNRLCGMGENTVTISCNGDVFPCIPFKQIAGNIRTQSMKKIWRESPLFVQIRSLKNRDLEECSSCELLQYCARCTAAAYNETGNLLGCSSLCRQVAEARRLMTADLLVQA